MAIDTKKGGGSDQKQIAPKILQNMEIRDQMCFDLVAFVHLHVGLSMCLRCLSFKL